MRVRDDRPVEAVRREVTAVRRDSGEGCRRWRVVCSYIVSKGWPVKIRDTRTLAPSTKAELQASILEAIAELEQQHRDGVMETPAYLIKKRALVRML